MRINGKSDLIDLEMTLHHETDRAVLVSLWGEREKAVWLPKSAIEMEPTIGGHPNVYEVTLPEQLATDKGLV